MHEAAKVARSGASDLYAARSRVRYAVEDARTAGFFVGSDLSVMDRSTGGSATQRAARAAQAQVFAGDIRQRAAQLIELDAQIAGKVAAAAAGIRDTFPQDPTPGEPPKDNPVQAVDNHTFKEDPPLPFPVAPRDMTEAQARAAWDAVCADIAQFNTRCGRTFLLPNEQASYDACIADRGPLLERQAAIRARLGELGVPVEAELPPAPDPAGEPPGEGLPPAGVTPPVEGNLTVGPPSRPSQQARGGESLWDEHGGEWRFDPRNDRWHHPHWDYNPHDTPNSQWQNVPIGDLPTHK
ncbi:hypothetical protein [Mycobacterium simulans]|uniref:hypothetical protein n=1 Tax=Mycobacterium simulans TaxID=627089 RepID=UPI001641CE85|nr:hypothetical protein [Mycobacterium simulans]